MIKPLFCLLLITVLSSCSSNYNSRTQKYSLHQQSQRFLSSLSFDEKVKARHNNRLELKASELSDESERELRILLSQLLSNEVQSSLASAFNQNQISFPFSISRQSPWSFSLQNPSGKLTAKIQNAQCLQIKNLTLSNNPYLDQAHGLIEVGESEVEESETRRCFSLLEKDVVAFRNTLDAKERDVAKKQAVKAEGLSRKQKKALGRIIHRWADSLKPKGERKVFTSKDSSFQWNGILADDKERSLVISSPKAQLKITLLAEDSEEIKLEYSESQDIPQ